MKVSVAIATYNRAGMVRQAVEAVLAQSPYEVVVTDDASTDATWEALTDLAAADPRVRIFRRDRNSGGVENWNYALRECTGDYLAWCSDDDRHLPGHLADSVRYLEAHPEVGLVHAGFIDAVETPGDSQQIARPLRFPETRMFRPEQLAWYLTRYYDWPFHPSTIVMRRRVWEETGPFDPAYALADTDWFARAAERFPVAMLARHGVLNRRHPGNWSNRLGSARMQQEIRNIVERSIVRLYAQAPLRRWFWRALWRANVRLRLALTLAVRARSGHGEAACAAWRQLINGSCLPGSLAQAGEHIIRKFSARHAPAFDDARQSVSPL